MDVAGFVDLLTRSGLDVTPLEIAEALWLARLRDSARAAGAGRSTATHAARAGTRG